MKTLFLILLLGISIMAQPTVSGTVYVDGRPAPYMPIAVTGCNHAIFSSTNDVGQYMLPQPKCFAITVYPSSQKPVLFVPRVYLFLGNQFDIVGADFFGTTIKKIKYER